MKKHGKNRAKNKEPTKFRLKLMSALLFAGVVSLGITSPPVHAAENTEISVTVPSEMSIRFNEDGSTTASNFSVRNASLVPIQLNGLNTSMKNGWTLSDGTTFNKNQKAFHLRLDNQIIRNGTNSVNINVPDNSTKTFRVGIKRGVYTQSIAKTTAMTIETTYSIGKKDFSVQLRDPNGTVLQTLTGKNGDTIILPNLTSRAGEQVESYTSTKTGKTYYPGNKYTIPIGGDILTITWGAKPVTINATAGWLVHVPQANTENMYGYTLPSELNKPGYVVDYYTSNDTAYGNDYTGHQFKPYDTIKIPENGILNLKPHFRKLNSGEHIIEWYFNDKDYHSYDGVEGLSPDVDVHVNIASNIVQIPRTFTESNPYVDVPSILGTSKRYKEVHSIQTIFLYDSFKSSNIKKVYLTNDYKSRNIQRIEIPEKEKYNNIKIGFLFTSRLLGVDIKIKNASKYEDFDFNVPFLRGYDIPYSTAWQGVQKIPNAKDDGRTFLGWKNDKAYYDKSGTRIPENSIKKNVTIMNNTDPCNDITFTAVYDKKAVTYKDESGKVLKKTIIPNTQTGAQLQPPTVNGQWLHYMTIESEKADYSNYQYKVEDALHRDYYFDTEAKAQAFANTSSRLRYCGKTQGSFAKYYYPNDTINIDQDTTIILHTIPYRKVSFEKKNSSDPTITQLPIRFKSGVDTVKLPNLSNENYYVTGYVDKNSSHSFSNSEYYVTKDDINYYFSSYTDAENYAKENDFSDKSVHYDGTKYIQATYYPNQTLPGTFDKDMQLQVIVKPYVRVNYTSRNSGLNFPPTKTKEGQTIVLPDLPYDGHYVDHYTDQNGKTKYPEDAITIGTSDITLTPTFAPMDDKSGNIGGSTSSFSSTIKPTTALVDHSNSVTVYDIINPNTGEVVHVMSPKEAQVAVDKGWASGGTITITNTTSSGSRLARYYNGTTHIHLYDDQPVPSGYWFEDYY